MPENAEHRDSRRSNQNQQFMNDFASNGGAMALIAGMMMTILIVASIIGLFFIICFWKILSKAGEPGWASIIPIYREILLFKMIGKPAWWVLVFVLAMIPVVNFVGIFVVFGVMIYLNLELAKAFGQSTGFAVGLILLPIVFIPILAFGDSVYVGPGGVPATAPTVA